MQIRPTKGEWINILNYSVTNNYARLLGKMDLYVGGLELTLVVGISAVVTEKSQDLYNVYDYTGSLVCTTDQKGWDTIKQYLQLMVTTINTYTISGTQVESNNTQYCDYISVTKVIPLISVTKASPLKVNSMTYYQCYGNLGTVLFATDEQGYKVIVSSSTTTTTTTRK